MPQTPPHIKVNTSKARDRLSAIIDQVQNPRSAVVLTRHGRDVAAIVSMEALSRIDRRYEAEDIIHHGHRPSRFTFGKGFQFFTNAEAAEHIQQVQLDRRTEREVLAKAGLDVVPGGELVEEAAVVEQKKRWWLVWCKSYLQTVLVGRFRMTGV